MKQSQYLDQRRKHHLRHASAPAPAAERLAASDAEAAEAAGVQWDPEEPELPARLVLRESASEACIVEDEDERRLLIIAAAVKHDTLRRAVMRSMVDAYNAWGPQGEKRAKLAAMVAFDAPLPRARSLVNDARDLLGNHS